MSLCVVVYSVNEHSIASENSHLVIESVVEVGESVVRRFLWVLP